MKERERQLSDLTLDVRINEVGDTKSASVGTMQTAAKQHIILVAGPGRAIRDALRGAQLNKVRMMYVLFCHLVFLGSRSNVLNNANKIFAHILN